MDIGEFEQQLTRTSQRLEAVSSVRAALAVLLSALRRWRTIITVVRSRTEARRFVVYNSGAGVVGSQIADQKRPPRRISRYLQSGGEFVRRVGDSRPSPNSRLEKRNERE